MSSTENKAQAHQAVKYTGHVIFMGAGNRWTLNAVNARVLTNLGRAIDYISPGDPYGDERVPEFIRLGNRRAHLYHAGNCGEHAACAFMYLYERNVAPIDFFTGKPKVDHDFVVIGRRDGSEASDPDTWGDECWVCDAWDGKVFPADGFRYSMYKAQEIVPKSECRVG